MNVLSLNNIYGAVHDFHGGVGVISRSRRCFFGAITPLATISLQIKHHERGGGAELYGRRDTAIWNLTAGPYVRRCSMR